MHWAEKHIGKKWVPGARGPDTFDCWGLLCFVYKTRYGIRLPLNIIDALDIRKFGKAIHDGTKYDPDWTQIDKPVEGCGVALSQSRVFHHVGIWLEIDDGLILHCHGNSYVVAQSIQNMKINKWKQFKFYVHKDFKYDKSSTDN